MKIYHLSVKMLTVNKNSRVYLQSHWDETIDTSGFSHTHKPQGKSIRWESMFIYVQDTSTTTENYWFVPLVCTHEWLQCKKFLLRIKYYKALCKVFIYWEPSQLCRN